MTTPLPGELDVLRDISARLEEAGIPYMLTGSLAMSYYTTPRMTRDIDVVAQLSDSDIGRVVALFESGYYVSPDAVMQAVRDRSSFNLIEQTSVTKVDVFPKKQEPFRDIEFARRRRVTIADFSTWIVAAEDLIVMGKDTPMTDTSPDVEQRYREMLLARSPAERMMMAARMFDTARAMVLASLPSDLSPEDSRRRLFERLYGHEIPLHLLPAVLRPR